MAQRTSTNIIPMRSTKSLTINGYVVHLETINRLCNLFSQISTDTEATNAKVTYSATLGRDRTVRYNNLEAVLDQLNNTNEEVSDFSIQYDGDINLSIAFNPKGKIELNASGTTPDLQYYSDQVLREIERCDQEHNWAVKTFIFKKWPTSILSSAIVSLSFGLFITIGMFFLAQSIGVNVDPSIIPPGNTYFRQVEEALKTQDINKKLDTLLIGQLRGFTNASDFISQQQKTMTFLLAGIAVSAILLFILNRIQKLYPRSFFALGRQKEKFAKMERQREVWGIGIIVAFIINIVSGILLSFFG
jgi:hypothetical protein